MQELETQIDKDNPLNQENRTQPEKVINQQVF